MDPHNSLKAIYNMMLGGGAVIPDPGDGHAIQIDKAFGVCELTIGAGSETRSLPTATALGTGVVLTVVANQISGGSCTLEGVTFDTEGDTVTFRVATVNGALAWVNSITTPVLFDANLVLNSTNEMNFQIGGISVLAIDDAAIVSNAPTSGDGKSVFIETQDGGAGSPTGSPGGNFSLTAGIGSDAATSSNAAGGAAGSISLVTQAGGAGDGAGVAGKDGVIRLISNMPIIKKFAAVQTATTADTLTPAQILGSLLVGTPTAGATAYQLPLAADLDDALSGSVGTSEGFEFTILNLGADADDIITITTNTGWTLAGAMTVPSGHSSTGVVYGNSATFTARRTAADTYLLYRK